LVLYMTRRAYKEGETLPVGLSIGWWVLDAAWTSLVALSSLYNLMPLRIGEDIAYVSGLALFGVGVILTSAGIVEFRSLHRVSGLEASKLITTGIYRRSRNPQFLGFYLALLGMSLLGRSGYALMLTTIVIIYCHYYIVKAEEPHLERIFGEEYLLYKSRTPRYIGVSKRGEGRS
ncbi:MAG: methyltransferase family protein, partial [Candidatus Bathyarchaeia archaeon]